MLIISKRFLCQISKKLSGQLDYYSNAYMVGMIACKFLSWNTRDKNDTFYSRGVKTDLELGTCRIILMHDTLMHKTTWFRTNTS